MCILSGEVLDDISMTSLETPISRANLKSDLAGKQKLLKPLSITLVDPALQQDIGAAIGTGFLKEISRYSRTNDGAG